MNIQRKVTVQAAVFVFLVEVEEEEEVVVVVVVVLVQEIHQQLAAQIMLGAVQQDRGYAWEVWVVVLEQLQLVLFRSIALVRALHGPVFPLLVDQHAQTILRQ